MLEVANLHVFYGKSHVLRGISFVVQPGEIVTLLGRNGSGRSTTAKAIMGLLNCQGNIFWKNINITGKLPHQIARMGLGYVPENREVFPSLTVHQNLMLGQKSSSRSSRWSFNEAYALFPGLHKRQHIEAAMLSGGEQQMLTLCRTLMGEPELIMIDEPAEGLAPHMVELLGQCLQTLKARGISVFLIDQKLQLSMAVSDRVLVMGRGTIIFDGTFNDLCADACIREEWLEV